MAEIRIKVIERFLHIYSKIAFDRGLKVNIIRKSDIKLEHVLSGKHTDVEFLKIKNVPILIIKPKKAIKNKALLYFHGGSYVSGPIKLQIDFIKNLVIKTQNVAYIVDYRKTPEFTYKETFEDVKKIYNFILSKYSNKNITIIGDSAGGGLTLSLTMYLRNMKKPLPGRNILLSPWLDVSLTNKEITKILDEKDYVLSRRGLVEAGKAYAGDKSVKDYIISPLYGTLENLPETLLLVGTNEILIHDCREFKEKAKKEKLKLKYIEYNEMFHAFMVAPPVLEGIKQANIDIISYINSDI